MSSKRPEVRSLDMQFNAFLAQDRRVALARGVELPAIADGAVLFADISGFTPLTEALAAKLGPSRGAEALTRLLNLVYAALIGEVERHGGSVIGFSGDAITCWFSSSQVDPTCASAAAVACASALHTAMGQFAGVMVVDGVHAALSVKVAVASGAAMRCIVGDPARQRIEVIAGATLDRMAAAEQSARQSETVVDQVTAARLELSPANVETRTTATGEPLFVWRSKDIAYHATPPEALPVLPRSITQPWLLPAVQERLVAGQGRFTAELRPATALFLHFAGIDFEHDADAANQLDRFVRWVQQVISHFEGALIQLTTGDKGSYLYAAFGAPITHDDDPLRAVAAAMQLRQPPAEIAGKLVLRIGVSYGLMRVGPYGSANRLTYGVLGDATNMAARLMVQAPEGAVWLSEQVAAQVEARYAFTHRHAQVQGQGTTPGRLCGSG
ncbi:MAG: hypothetical protein IPK16_03930 [Anaerolineales bacterium]|nr:hypothetical protein [Anaerolineales bacterium]